MIDSMISPDMLKEIHFEIEAQCLKKNEHLVIGKR